MVPPGEDHRRARLLASRARLLRQRKLSSRSQAVIWSLALLLSLDLGVFRPHLNFWAGVLLSLPWLAAVVVGLVLRKRLGLRMDRIDHELAVIDNSVGHGSDYGRGPTPQRCLEPDPTLDGRTTSLGRSLGLRESLWSPRMIFTLVLGFFTGSIFTGSLLNLRPFWLAVFPGACGAAVGAAVVIASAAKRAPFSVATLSPRGVRLRWGPKTRFVPWTEVRGIRREGSLREFDEVGVWDLSLGAENASPGTLRITDGPALGILRYPGCPRLPLTPKEFQTAERLGAQVP